MRERAWQGLYDILQVVEVTYFLLLEMLSTLIIWNYAMLDLFTVDLVFYLQMLNWLFGCYRTSTTLPGEN